MKIQNATKPIQALIHYQSIIFSIVSDSQTLYDLQSRVQGQNETQLMKNSTNASKIPCVVSYVYQTDISQFYQNS